MYKNGRILMLTVACILLFAGVAFAGVVTVVQPDGGESLTAGQVYTISIGIDYDQIATNNRVAKYKLSYSCKGSDFINHDTGARIWKGIAMRWCGLECPQDFPWTVPNVQIAGKPTRECKVKAQLFNANGNSLGSDTSDDWFFIQPFGGVAVCPPYCL